LALAPRPWAAQLIHFWFHHLSVTDWWRGSESVDSMLRRFQPMHQALANQPPASFLSDPQTALGAVLLFDQVPRNIFRKSSRAFATDPLARAIAHGALDRAFEKRLRTNAQRQFLAMPLMHSEDITDHIRSLSFFRLLGPRGGFAFARQHSLMIARFGRYPHRNDVLGRKSSEAERKAVAAGYAW